MAGKMRLAAKCLLGTTLLASGTGGVYYATTQDWSQFTFGRTASKPGASDLDAVASAWAEPAAPRNDSQSSPTARSASAAAKAASDDRYAVLASLPPAPIDSSTDDAASKEPQKAQPDAPTPEKTERSEPVSLASRTERDDSEKQPTVASANSSPEAALARGQELKDDAAVVVQAKNRSDIGGALNAAAKGGNSIREPQPLRTPDQQTPIAETAQRAKQAFGSSSPTMGDRYGDESPAPATARAPKTEAVNPFNAKPMAGATAKSKGELIEPLPANDIGGPLRELQQGDEGLRPLETSRAAPMTSRDMPSQNRGMKDVPIGAEPSGDTQRMPPPRGGLLPTASDSLNQAPVSGNGTGKPGEKALEGPQQPTLVIQKFAPGEIQVGKPAKFVLQVRNAGAQSADNVTIHDEVPQGTQLISTSPNATNDGSRLVWQLGKLSAGEDRTVEMQVMPKSEGDIGSVATVTYSAQASVKTHCTMPQLAIRMTAPSEVMIGNQQHVKIEVRNPGSGDATGVILFENVPPNVKHVAGPTLEFEIGTLRAGETRELDLVLTAEKAGKVINTLTARAEGNLQVQQQVEFEVIAPALTVALQGPERRYLERPATYEVSVENPGTAAAHDVQIVTKLPKGMRFVKANNMGEYDATSHAVYWSLAELPKGERGTVEVVAMPVETGPQTLQVESRAQQGLSDKTQREVLVEGLAAIKFEVRAMEDPIEVGGETGYEIRVVNQGTKAATNVQVVAELPAGLKFISAEGESQHKSEQGRIVFEPLQQLAPKADTVYRLRAQGTQAGDQRVVVEVKTDDLQQPIRREESTRVFGDQ